MSSLKIRAVKSLSLANEDRKRNSTFGPDNQTVILSNQLRHQSLTTTFVIPRQWSTFTASAVSGLEARAREKRWVKQASEDG